MKNENLIQEAIRHLSKDERNEHIIDLLRRFLLSNQQQPSGKFNIYNYVLRDESRPVLQCVYHAEGFRVATDATIIVALAKQDYPKELEGKLLTKTAEEVEGKFPNWRAVIPDKSRAKYVWIIDRDGVADAVKQQRQVKKEGRDAFVAIDLFGNHFDPAYLLKLIDFAKHIGANSLNVGSYINGGSYCNCYGEDGSVGMLMCLNLSYGRQAENIIVTL